MAPRTATSIAAALAVAALAACSGSADQPAGGATTQTTTPSAATTSATTTSAATTSAATSTTTSGATTTTTTPASFRLTRQASVSFPNVDGELGVGVAVRVGRHAGYDRVVYEFSGTGTPSYAVRYVAQPIGDPSGQKVDVAGDAYLEVLVAGVGYPDSREPEPAEVPSAQLAGTVIAESGVIYAGFEGLAQTFIGVDGRARPFAVSTLTGPSRLVVDIATG